MIRTRNLIRQNKRYARLRWGRPLGVISLSALANLTEKFNFSVANGDLLFLENGWYVTHSGLMSLASRRRCAGIRTQPVLSFCDPLVQRWAFKATIFKSSTCRGFVGYGDADPSNVSISCSGRRNAGGGNQSRQPCPAQSIRNRHLLGRRDRVSPQNCRNPPQNRRNFLPSLQMGTETAHPARRFETGSVKSFGSISSIPIW